MLTINVFLIFEDISVFRFYNYIKCIIMNYVWYLSGEIVQQILSNYARVWLNKVELLLTHVIRWAVCVKRGIQVLLTVYVLLFFNKHFLPRPNEEDIPFPFSVIISTSYSSRQQVVFGNTSSIAYTEYEPF